MVSNPTRPSVALVFVGTGDGRPFPGTLARLAQHHHYSARPTERPTDLSFPSTAPSCILMKFRLCFYLPSEPGLKGWGREGGGLAASHRAVGSGPPSGFLFLPIVELDATIGGREGGRSSMTVTLAGLRRTTPPHPARRSASAGGIPSCARPHCCMSANGSGAWTSPPGSLGGLLGPFLMRSHVRS